MAIANLSSVIAYNMVDMSYEGSYFVLPEDREDDSAADLQDQNENTATLTDKEALWR